MPLDKSRSMQAVHKNIAELVRTGRPVKQAVAIAMREAGKSHKPGRKGYSPSK